MSTRADPLEPTNTVRWNGRSFHWAARFMRAETARDAATLYTFCRRVDDLGDGHPPRGRAARARRRARRADG